MTPDDYCREKVAQSGSSFYYSFLFLPPDQRRGITALYAFCREVDDVVDSINEPAVAHAKLLWWRQEIQRVYAGQAQHPVARALQPIVGRYSLPQAHFQTMIDGMTMDLEQNRYLDFAALEQYCHRVAGVVGLMSAEIFGYEHPDTRLYARNLGIAFQLTNILRDVGEDARRGRIYLPQEDLARFGVTERQIAAGDTGGGWRALIDFEVKRARAMLQSGAPLAARLRGRIGFELRMVVQGGLRILEKIERVDGDVFRKRPMLKTCDWPLMAARALVM